MEGVVEGELRVRVATGVSIAHLQASDGRDRVLTYACTMDGGTVARSRTDWLDVGRCLEGHLDMEKVRYGTVE